MRISSTIFVMILLFLGAFWGVPRPLGAQDLTARSELALEIDQAMRDGSWDRALEACRAFTATYPGEPRMLYNLACLENRAGQPEAALTALRQAIAAGFDDMGFALQDPDLAGIVEHPTLLDLDVEQASKLALLGIEKGATLQFQQWTDVRSLEPHSAQTPEAEEALPDLRLRWVPIGLQIEVHLPGRWASALAGPESSPWTGGSGLNLTLAIPDGTASFASANYFAFAFGTAKGGGAGAIFLPGQNRWQLVEELNPKIRPLDDGSTHLTATIPWLVISPYHPLVDNPLGLNLTLRLPRQEAYAKASLVPDPWSSAPGAPQRRFATLEFEAETLTNEFLMGRISDSVSGSEPVTLDLTAICNRAGQGRLTIDFLDSRMRSVLPEGPRPEAVALVAGPNRLTRQADFSALEPGPYLLKVDLALPSFTDLTWGTAILHLPAGWQNNFRSRIDLLGPADQPTARHHLAAILTAEESHQVRQNPSPMATTVGELESMLDRAEAVGSILPGTGSLLYTYPGPDGQDRLCHLYFPVGRDTTSGLNPILVLNRLPGQEARIIRRIGQHYRHRLDSALETPLGQGVSSPVYLVPHLPQAGPEAWGQAAGEAEACLAWALSLFAAEKAAVVGVDFGGGPALQLITEHADQIMGLLVLAGSELAPWPQAIDSYVAQQLPKPKGPLPVTWVDFEMETQRGGQGDQIVAQLESQGWDVVAQNTVRGGLSISQAADRLVLWTEDLLYGGSR